MRRRIIQALAAIVVLLIAIGIAAPFLHADRYSGRIETALSAALGRPVTIGGITLDLFTGPGFAVSNVIIAGDSPGSEPFAYVGELRAVPRIWSLWTGRLEFSSLTLEDAHVNLARSTGDMTAPVWNFESLLRPGLLATFPTIRLRGARVNFKMGGRKNTFYLLDTDLDVTPRSRDGSDWDVRFTGEPARTDRPANGFGAIEARGEWKEPSAGGSGRLEFDVRLDRSEIADMVALVNGHDAGVQGLISGRVHLAGPAASVGLEGSVRIAELHGWDQSPPPGGVFEFRLSGFADTQSQHLELFAEPRSQQTAVKARLVADGYLQKPIWRFDVHSNALPVASLPGLLRNFGARIPDDLQLSGTMRGDVSYEESAGWKGQAAIHDAALAFRNLPALRFEEASLDLANGSARLQPVSMISGMESIGFVGGDYSLADGSFDVALSSSGGPVAGLLKTFPIESVPLLSSLQSGSWDGFLTFVQPADRAGEWSGKGLLTDATAAIPELAEPLNIDTAQVQIKGDAIQMDRIQLSSGGVSGSGEYRYVPGAPHPHLFRLSIGSANAAQMQALFLPVLRRKINLIDMALTLGRAPIPDWLRTMHADGTIQVGDFEVAGSDLKRVKSRVVWDGAQIVLSDWQSRFASAALAAKINIDLRETTPRYSANARWTGLEWQGGRVDGNFRVQTAGTGIATLSNLKIEGSFNGRDLAVEPLGLVERLTGQGQMSWNDNGAHFEFPQLRLTSGGETWTGSGNSRSASQGASRSTSQSPSDEVELQLSNNGRQMNLAGSLTEPAKTWVAE